METLSDIALFSNSAVQLLLDTIFKSVILLVLALGLLRIIRKQISSSLAHQILLSTLVCIALVPLSVWLVNVASADGISPGTIGVFVVGNTAQTPDISLLPPSEVIAIALYLFVVSVLIASLAHSALQLIRIHRLNAPLREQGLLNMQEQLRLSLGIKRKVALLWNPSIQSPLSYGLFNPVIAVPEKFLHWDTTIQREVLIHELSHIRRLDWPVLIFTRILVSLLWINPLLWIAAKKLHDESEQACDSAIVSDETDRIRYAENLLRIAGQHKYNTSRLLAQPMYERGELSMRIKNILEGKLAKDMSKLGLSTLILAVTMFSLAGNSVRLFAQDSGLPDADYYPVSTQVPVYPRSAADAGIEGWILFSFTVRSDGRIDPGTVSIVDAEPTGYFENSAQNALLNFQFEPRIRDGLAVDVPGVQYLFRYELENDGNPDFDRPAPQPLN